jgi:hypothetical protein
MYFVLCTTTYALGSAVSQLCFRDAKAQELPRLNRSSMHNLATGTFIFCRALESILSSSSSDPGVCQVYICDCNLNCYSIEAVQRFYHLYKKVRVCTHPQNTLWQAWHAKVLTPIEVII